MLKLKNISKVYKAGSFEQKALNGVNLQFKQGEFVSVLGPSGSGKTTTLNIIGGLDIYSDGDLIINGKSTKKFTDSDWDAYRNNSIGFIFQSYNLIGHLSVLDNVELGMTLSGISDKERKEKSLEVLKRVGLSDHVNKKPSQLSGGQKQRVAIARALVNNPDVILADEPTGALDSKTSVEIMELIKEISNNKLVIMVTHNPKLAKKYSTRIIELEDGQVINDSNPVTSNVDSNNYRIKKTSMNFITALKLSFNNLRTKKIRTLITAFAGSIGIIGVAMVLFISNGMNAEISNLESEQLSSLPIMVNESPMTLKLPSGGGGNNEINEIKIDESGVTPFDPITDLSSHKNNITEDYIDYITKLDSSLGDIQYQLGLQMNILVKNNDNIQNIATNNKGSLSFKEIPTDDKLINEQYEVINGKFPVGHNELLLVVDEYNRLDQNVLLTLGLDIDEGTISFDSIIGKELVVAKNNDYYEEMESIFPVSHDLSMAYKNGFKVTIVGVARPIVSENERNSQVNTITSILSPGLWYKNDLTEAVITDSINSNISITQLNKDYNVLTGKKFSEKITKDDVLKFIGAIDTPVGVTIYPTDFESKTQIKEYLDSWNDSLDEDHQILYTDLAENITSMMDSMVSMIQTVLVAFAGISLVVSTIMIGIITYVSVLERTKEIGVLRSLGARKKDISRVFNAETFIVGLISGSLGIFLTYVLSDPVNKVLSKSMQIDQIVVIDVNQSIMLIAISVALTLVSGLIPAKIAAKKDPVKALRTE
ncbi:ATP-binding cassette domain-containing protein [Tepidibacter hydrothermalis]|uniref:ATP-binding cassette domain-containing protein n=1 Tax=Tepidibacter hydrothermalis TaxID=3036126 RepID=A0ABY8EIT1_9FIRM|nr:ABC transporter ATP-binding protein/permease [Tepidibacter hydrothermalis]WFD11920.1 ATP-binding cassette domain-containing protein [Tepidibacter hydrothermalis]